MGGGEERQKKPLFSKSREEKRQKGEVREGGSERGSGKDPGEKETRNNQVP